MALYADSCKQLGDHSCQILWQPIWIWFKGTLKSYHIWWDLTISFCISVYCKLSGAVLRSISLWQDSKSKTDLPEDSEHPEDSWCVCSPAAAVQRSAVEVVEAFLATLGKMCCHVFHKQIHVCSVAASLSEVRVCSVPILADLLFGWLKRRLAAIIRSQIHVIPYPEHIHISAEVQFVQKECRKMFASLFVVGL